MDPATLIMIGLLVVLVFFMFRNKKKRDQQQADLQSKLVPGVEVMLSFGLYGTVVSIDDETNVAEVEVAPGTVVKVHRQTLGRVVETVVLEEAVADDELDATTGASPASVDRDSTLPASTEADKKHD